MTSSGFGSLPAIMNIAENLGEALGRGVARGLASGMHGVDGAARRGRPPKSGLMMAPSSDRACSVPGCGREMRSKGMCSAHYQAARRKALARA
jgi:hypothetical protein